MKKKLFVLISFIFSLCTTAVAQITPPTLDTPSDGTVYTSNATPTLYCNAKSGAVRYIFQWDTVATFDSPLLSTHSSSYKGYTAQDLKFNTQYYWRAAVTSNNGDTSAWSAVRTFTTMVQPSLDTPLDNAVYTSTATPTLDCNTTTGVGRYIFQWDTVATFDSPLLTTHSSSYKGYTAQDLKFNTQYYWRAAVTNGDNSDTSAWSAVRTFTTMVRPSLDTPLDNAVYTSTATPTLDCNTTTGVGRYIFQWDTVATFDSPLLSTHSSSYKGYTAQDLKFNTQYYWRAAVTNGDNSDTSAWSAVRTFTTMVRPSLDTPLDSTVYTSTAAPTLYCNITTGVERYIFQWDTVATFDSPLLSTHSSSYKGYTAQDLKFNTQYYWRAAVTNGDNSDTSAWSVVRTFTTMSAPTLSSPTNGAYNISLNPTLSCNTISNVTHYIFEWDTVPTFNSPAYNTYRSSYRSITANNLLTANYYWRAAVTNNNGDTSLWSEVWQFSTRPAPVTSEFSATVCDSYVWNGHRYNTSGDYTQTLRAQNQADSIVTLHLTVNVSKDTLINITIWDREIPYDWHGQQITETGEYTWLGTTAEGCDSLVVADIFVMVVDNLDYTEENLFTITPNPVKRGETVLIDAEVGEPFIVEVYASDSRLLQRISAADSPFRLTMPTTNGLYLLRLVTASGRFLYSKVLVR